MCSPAASAAARRPLGGRRLGTPVLINVDADQRIVFRHTGPFTTAQRARRLVAEHLGVRL